MGTPSNDDDMEKKFPKGSMVKFNSGLRLVIEELGDIRFLSSAWGKGSTFAERERCKKTMSFTTSVAGMESDGFVACSPEEEAENGGEWPKQDDPYWYISTHSFDAEPEEMVHLDKWEGLPADLQRQANFGVHRTKQAAIEAVKRAFKAAKEG